MFASGAGGIKVPLPILWMWGGWSLCAACDGALMARISLSLSQSECSDCAALGKLKSVGPMSEKQGLECPGGFSWALGQSIHDCLHCAVACSSSSASLASLDRNVSRRVLSAFHVKTAHDKGLTEKAHGLLSMGVIIQRAGGRPVVACTMEKALCRQEVLTLIAGTKLWLRVIQGIGAHAQSLMLQCS